MASKKLFKVWDVTRTKKIFVALPQSDDLYEQVILTASAKLQIDGVALALESDGTIIDNSDTLSCLTNEILILLDKNDNWISVDDQNNLFTSSSSTITNLSINSLLSSDDIILSNENIESNATNTNIRPNVERSDSPVVDENTWLNLSIPWDRLSSETKDDCEKGIKNQQSATEVVHLVVNKMREMKTFLPAKAIKIVAKQIVQKYPLMFLDMDDDKIIIGDGTHTIFSKIQDRNNYLNRPHKTRRLIKGTPVPKKKIKTMVNARSGCSNWQPDSETSVETLEQKQEILKNKSWKDDEELFFLLNDTFPLQRLFLNNAESPPTIEKIIKEWPILLENKIIKWHYQKLMDHSIEILTENLIKKADTIISFHKKDSILTNMSNDEKFFAAIDCIAKYFKEDLTFLVINFEDGTPLENMRGKVAAPSICSVLGPNNKFIYYISIENQIVNEGSSTFEDALQLCFALYYILNMEYPKEIACTLELLQRYFLKIHPDVGSRSKRHCFGKVISYINKITKLFPETA